MSYVQLAPIRPFLTVFRQSTPDIRLYQYCVDLKTTSVLLDRSQRTRQRSNNVYTTQTVKDVKGEGQVSCLERIKTASTSRKLCVKQRFDI
jgi:hypothetical protein